ncbi:hypothetical protein [Rubritalea tangerina]
MAVGFLSPSSETGFFDNQRCYSISRHGIDEWSASSWYVACVVPIYETGM